MFRFISKLIFAFRFRRAVEKADAFRRITHRRYLVIPVNGKLEVVSKQELKKLLSYGIFRKGTTVRDIEDRALYITL